MLVSPVIRMYVIIHLDTVKLKKYKHTGTNMLSLPDNLKANAVKTKKEHRTHLVQ